jgi:hypothetical protein
MFLLRKGKPRSFILKPSITIFPSDNFTSLNKLCKIELLPAPVLPTIPTFIPDSTVKQTLLIAGV